MSEQPLLDPRGLPAGYAFKEDWEVTPRQAKAMLSGGAGGAMLLDVRRDDEVQLTRIGGSVHIPLAEVERRADELEAADGSRSHPIIVHCHHGVRSLKATAALRALGFTDVRSMAGGIDLWSRDIDPGVKRY